MLSLDSLVSLIGLVPSMGAQGWWAEAENSGPVLWFVCSCLGGVGVMHDSCLHAGIICPHFRDF